MCLLDLLSKFSLILSVIVLDMISPKLAVNRDSTQERPSGVNQNQTQTCRQHSV
jgi:hypothetical protein